MSVQHFSKDVDGAVNSEADGKTHDVHIVSKNGSVIVTIAPFGDHTTQITLLPSHSQLKTLALSLLEASQAVSAVRYEDIPRPLDRG